MSSQMVVVASRFSATLISLVLLSACGGGGGGGSSTVVPPNSGGTPPPVAQKCSANNPFRVDAVAPTTVGTLADEKSWVQNYVNGAYLWYNEMPSVNASLAAYSNEADVFGSLQNYFNALLTPARTTSGKLKDEFSFIYSTKQWRELSQSGTSLSFGIEWYLASSTPPRGIRVAYVEPNSPAAQQGLQRGDTLVSFDGVSADTNVQSELDTLNQIFSPSNGNGRSFVFDRNGSQVTAFFGATEVIKQPVLVSNTLDINGQKVGYMVFNDHIASAEQPLIDSFTQFSNAGVSDLILDLRYNGGGYLFLASEVAYMIAGPTRTNGKYFEKLQYNDKRVADNNQSPTPFYNTSCIINSQFQCTGNQSLPNLNLGRVFVLTSKSTCSASEAIINGLEGIDVQVIRIGATTCGKPYGFTAKDNCGISYFPIEFKGINFKGFGDYADGFSAQCAAADDFSKALGDTSEGMLAAALYRRANGSCPATTGQQKLSVEQQGIVVHEPVRSNRFVLPEAGR